MTTEKLLAQNPTLLSADPRTLRLLAEQAELRTFEAGGRIAHSGSPQTHVLVLCKGAAQLYRRNRETRAQIMICNLEAPAIFGDSECFAGQPWTVSARAVNATEIVAVKNSAFEQAIASDAGLAAALYRNLGVRHVLNVQVMQVLSLQKVRHKVLRLLWSLPVVAYSESHHRIVEVSLVGIARAIGVNVRTIARTLKDLGNGGVIVRRGARVELRLAEEDVFWDNLSAPTAGVSWRLAGAGL